MIPFLKISSVVFNVEYVESSTNSTICVPFLPEDVSMKGWIPYYNTIEILCVETLNVLLTSIV